MGDQLESGTREVSMRDHGEIAGGGDWRRLSVSDVDATSLKPCFAYLSDREAIAGAACLFADKRRIDSFALRAGLTVTRYFLDSGRADGPPAPGLNLEAMTDAVGTEESIKLVLVARLAALAPQADQVIEAIVRFQAHGVQIVVATDLDPKSRAAGTTPASEVKFNAVVHRTSSSARRPRSLTARRAFP